MLTSHYRNAILQLTLALLMCVLLPSQAAAFRCGTNLVKKGDHVLEVLKNCGEPAYVDEWFEDRTFSERPHELLPYHNVIRSISVKEWTYNFGRRKFMRMIRFENGVVTHIKTLDYGF